MKTNRREFIRTMAAVALAAAYPGFAAAKGGAPSSKPNVVVMFIDDMGWMDLGCYGSKFYETPNIDKLAKQGAMFTQAYSSCGVCSPTRASLMTGKYPHRLGFTDFINPIIASGPNSAESELPASEITIGEAFQEAGYQTGYVGKWHLGHKDSAMPRKHGFDWNIGTSGSGGINTYFFPYKKHPHRKERSSPLGFVTDLADGKDDDYLTDVLTDKGIGFIKETVKEGKKPFFLIYSHYAVHCPMEAPKELVEKYEAKKERMYGTTPMEMIPERFNRKVPSRQQNPVYAAMVENLDTNVAKIVEALDELGLTKNTIIVFTSDNGGCSNANLPTSNYPLRANKGWNYEGGIRIPAFVTWPGSISPMKSSEPIITMDIFPTLLDLTGSKQLPTQHIDGLSFAPLLRGKQKKLDRDFLAWWYPHVNYQGNQPSQAILKDGYKLVHFINQNATELYNLDKDIGEKNNLAKAEPERTRQLLETLNQWVKETRQLILKDPTVKRDKEGMVTIAGPGRAQVLYAFGKNPKARDYKIYTKPLNMIKGGIVNAFCKDPSTGDKTDAFTIEFGISKAKWKVVSCSSQNNINLGAQRAIDGNSVTFWHTQYDGGRPAHPHHIAIDLGETVRMEGFTYLPRQDGRDGGKIYDYEFYVSQDGQEWGLPVVKTHFANIENSHTQQVVRFRKPVEGRYIKLVSKSAVGKAPFAGAAEIGVLGTITIER